MQPRDWFSVGVRLFGLWVIYEGFAYFMIYFSDRVVELSRSDLSQGWEPSRYGWNYLVIAAGTIAFGFALVGGAERLTRWAFNEATSSESENPIDNPG